MTSPTSVSRDATRPNVRAGTTQPALGAAGSSASRDTTTPDLLDVLADIALAAKQARADIAAGVAAGHPVNGTSALRRIELAARDCITDHTNPRSHR